MNKKIIFSAFVLIVFVTSYFIAPKYVQSIAEKELRNLNYPHAAISKTRMSFNYMSFNDVYLSNDHSIKKIKAHGSLFNFLGFGEIKHIELDGLEAKVKTSSLINNLRENGDIFFKENLPAQKISLINAVFHLPLLSKDIKIGTKGTLEKQTETQDIKITSSLNSQDKTITFDGTMNGLISKTKQSSIDLNISNINLNHKLANMHRGTGWVNITQEHTKSPKISGQLDAGSGDILKLPSKNISLVLGEENKNYALILRAQAAGIDGVNLFTDISYGGSSSDLNMQSTLDIKDTNAFATYLESLSLKLKPQNMASFKNLKQTKITTRYLPERRFVDGPLPFDVTADSNKTNILNGTFLIYPTDMEIRGNAQTNSKHTKDIQTLLSIPDEKVSNDTLRLDGSLSNLF